MAGIDKIYGSYEQYLELREWLSKQDVEFKCKMGWSWPKKAGGDENGMLYKMCTPLEFMYEWDEPFEGSNRPLTNFPPEIDLWLADNCPLEFVRERLADQGHEVP